MIVLTKADEWVPTLPQEWTWSRLKELCEVQKSGVWGDDPPDEETGYPVARTADVKRSGKVTVQTMPLRKLDSRDWAKARCQPGDVIVVKSSGSQTNVISGRVARVHAHDGAFAFSNFLLRLRPNVSVCNPSFIFYVLANHITRHRVLRMVSTTTYPNLNVSEYISFPIAIPPLPTQKAIASFLDRKTAAIDTLIEKKEKLLELLAEKRSALINQAVNKGLDPNVPMKDSGIPWIGEIPEHWEVRPLGYRVSMQGGSTPSKQEERFWGGDIPWVSPKDMKRFEIDNSIDKLTSDALVETSIRLIEPGATLVVVRGMILARKLPVGLSVVPCTINQDMKAIVPGRGLDARYLSWQLDARTQEAMSLVEEAGHGTKTFRTDLFTKMKILIPPISEQREIITRLERHLASYDSADGNTRVSVERLKEYRQSLITAAVTGQLEIPVSPSARQDYE